MWTSPVIAVNVFVCAIVAVPTQNDISESFQDSLHQQNVQTILKSIEGRLRNLDNIYSMHLSPTLEHKFEQYQRKLEAIDTKIIRLESLVMLNLDKISENISTKNFKDDIAKTNLMKKMDAVYEGISHRLNYIDRKFDTSDIKIQAKLDTTVTRLEKMDEGFIRRNEDIEVELSDAIAALDDLKTSYQIMEENIVNNTNENFEVSLKEQMELMKSFNAKSIQALETLYENTTRDFDRFNNNIEKGLVAIYETNKTFENFKDEIKRELNEYAVKVAEMNTENWNTGIILQNKQNVLETIINSTKVEVQNGIRALMVLIGKITNKEQLLQADQAQIDKLTEKIDANFEKVFSAQSLFMDSCYRLQMDESQIESKISDILEKLIETFEQKTAIEIKDIKNLEKLIKNHDSHIAKNLYQANTNIVTIYEKMIKDHRQFDSDLKQVAGHLNALFSIVQDTLADENGSLSTQNANILLHDLNEMEKKIASLYEQGDSLTNTVGEIKGIVESLHDEDSSQVINDYFKNISQAMTRMEAKVNTAYLYYHFNRSKIDAANQNLTQQLGELINIINSKGHSWNDAETGNAATALLSVNSEKNESKLIPTSNKNASEADRNERLHNLITEIYGRKTPSNESSEITENADSNNKMEFINMVDLRHNFDDESEDNNSRNITINSEQSTIDSNTNQAPLNVNDSGEYDDFDLNNWQEIVD